jgi:hypothetical protein
VNMPLSTHICINSAGSPPTLANSMPCCNVRPLSRPLILWK